MKERILEIQDLTKHFRLRRTSLLRRPGSIKALNGISFSISRGESFGIVGESGCGKSTAGYSIVGLLKPTAGKVLFKGEEVNSMDANSLREFRKNVQLVFQDTSGSLNPRGTVEWILSEPLRAMDMAKKQIRNLVVDSLELVGLGKDLLGRFPHELSGGQKQRIGILNALILDPEVIIADEPVSSLDVSIQAQILNLMNDLQDRLSLTYLFISHDLNVVHYFCDRIAVMYLGEIVELSESEELYRSPLHPYTQSLLSAIPGGSYRKTERIILEGDAPSPMNPPSGCFFHPRCFKRMEICSRVKPKIIEVSKDHFVSCHLY
ncbi:ABC transporter ATP-binding protein [Mesotoga prima]|uniref:ABC transporter ATP-binding protein n=1 Tax=Mesotoga prima TaxID=1184387 RepID=UPI002BA47C91|nr:ABC transporter ATP-binding protein [Mesotoga prima]HQC14660.1 ABC transporter ATP-binding protein [Mesotoga prima]